jgi:opacity protein-like surface antigen
MSIRACSILACAGIMLASTTAEAGRHYHARPRHYRSHHHEPSYGPHYGAAHVGIFVPWGWYIGAGLVATRVLHQEGGDDLVGDGGGLSLHAGLRVHPLLALEAGWLGSFHEPRGASFGDDDSLILNAFTTDARVYLPVARPGSGFEPYLQAGLGVYLLDNAYFGSQSVGTGFQLGGGVDASLGQSFQIGVRLLYRGMAMGPVEESYTDTYVGAVTGELGLTLRF